MSKAKWKGKKVLLKHFHLNNNDLKSKSIQIWVPIFFKIYGS